MSLARSWSPSVVSAAAVSGVNGDDMIIAAVSAHFTRDSRGNDTLGCEGGKFGVRGVIDGTTGTVGA